MNNPPVSPPIPPTKDRKVNPLKVVSIMLLTLAALLLVVYVGVALYFSERFFPDTSAGGINLSFKTFSEAEEALGDKISNYTLDISGEEFELELTPEQAGLTIDAASVVDDMLASANSWMWPLEITKHHDYSDKLVASSKKETLTESITPAIEAFNTEAIAPTNAALSYDEATKSYTITPESIGTALDIEAVIKVAEEALAHLSRNATITEDQLLQPTIKKSDERLNAAISTANAWLATNLTLTMGAYPIGVVDASLLSGWITLDAEANAILDETALTNWVNTLVTNNNTVGDTRVYTRSDGKQITVSGGIYGWEIDSAALLTIVRDSVAASTVSTVEVPTLSYGTEYSGELNKDWGNRYLDIDLSEQHARLYDDSGALIWESDIVSGKPDGTYDTPSGVYWLNQKQSPSTLKGYENGVQIYETVVQYWMPFVGNAIGLHDADWQAAFGGTLYADGAGSHGCVNLPSDKAAQLYSLIQEGDVVVCHW